MTASGRDQLPADARQPASRRGGWPPGAPALANGRRDVRSSAPVAPVEVVREIFENVMNRRDADALRAFWAEDLVEELPTGIYRGPDEMARYFSQLFAALPDFHIEPLRIVGAAETVFVRWRATATFTGRPWQGIVATGARVALTGTDCFTFRGALITRNDAAFDQMEFARQVGLLPAQDSFPERVLRFAFNLRTCLAARPRSRSARGLVGV